jgi:tetratricopeptide (TPR) repeat protein
VILVLCFFVIGHASVELNTARIAYFNEQDYDRAKNACLKGIRKGQDNWELYAILSGSEIGLGNWQKAADALMTAFSKDTVKTGEWIENRGGGIDYFFQACLFSTRLLFDEEKYEEALKYLDFAEFLDPFKTDIYILRGAVLHKLGKWEEANKEYERVHNLDPEDPDINYLIGKSLFDAEEFESAVSYFNEAAEYYLVRYNREAMVVFQHLQEIDKILAQKIIVAWLAQDAPALNAILKNDLKYDQGMDVHGATIEKYYKATIDLARAYYFAGMSHYYLKQDSMAIENLLKNLELKPNDIDALYYTGECCLNLTEYEEAIPYFKRATELKEDDLYAWFYLGVCLAHIKKYKEAIDVYENHVLVLDPENIDAMSNLVFLYGRTGNHDKAIEYTLKIDELKKKQK